jgi:pimeloyl-ACP methyl ester carboxylesterase
MTHWSHDTIQAGGLKIHYYRTGGDKPAVILNHGAGDDGLCWTRIAKALENDYDVIMPDARGHGKSSSGNGAYSTEARVADLTYLIEALHVDRPFIGGHSMGAGTALSFAAAYPGLTRGIFLEDPPIFLPGETLVRDGKPVDQAKMGKTMITAMRLFKILPNAFTIPMLKKAQPTYPDEEILPMANAQKRVSADFINCMLAMSRAIAAPVELFGKITVPALLIIGDKEKMSIVSQEAARLAIQHNNKVEVLHLAGAGHNIRRDRFDGYLPALQAFLQKTG